MRKGTKHSFETRRKMSELRRGVTKSCETREKIRSANRGRKIPRWIVARTQARKYLGVVRERERLEEQVAS